MKFFFAFDITRFVKYATVIAVCFLLWWMIALLVAIVLAAFAPIVSFSTSVLIAVLWATGAIWFVAQFAA